MPRWEAGAQTRLTQAAYELYIERGFEHVTVAQIAERAGLTKRTFFRYFDDKREVLFSGAPALQDAVVEAVVNASGNVAPIDAVIAALAAAGSGITEIGEGARARQRLIESSSDLQEREMIKMVALKDAIGVAFAVEGRPRIGGKPHRSGRGCGISNRIQTLGPYGRTGRLSIPDVRSAR